MTLCEKCIHGDICAIQCGYDEGDERALTYCSEFKSKDDVVEVVRCKVCKWCEEDNWDGEILYGCDCAAGLNCAEPNGFCSYGERKDK